MPDGRNPGEESAQVSKSAKSGGVTLGRDGVYEEVRDLVRDEVQRARGEQQRMIECDYDILLPGEHVVVLKKCWVHRRADVD